jgi:hypothetical protein
MGIFEPMNLDLRKINLLLIIFFAGANVANKGNSFDGGRGGRISFLLLLLYFL